MILETSTLQLKRIFLIQSCQYTKDTASPNAVGKVIQVGKENKDALIQKRVNN